MKLVVVSLQDPVARGVGEVLGTGASTGLFVDGAPIRSLEDGTWVLHRNILHVDDSGLGGALPPTVGIQLEAVIFPSSHRSEAGRPALTVHPLGNLTSGAPVGGRPWEVNPVPARLMTEALLRLHPHGLALGIPATFECTHHGPFLPWPSFFLEAGGDAATLARREVHRALAEVLLGLEVARTREDPILIGVGGGHYVPHWGELARRREASFGHMIPRHHWAGLPAELLEQIVSRTPGVRGVIYARAQEAREGRFARWLPTIAERTLAARGSPELPKDPTSA